LRIVDQDGAPVAGARVEVFVEGGPTRAFAVAERPLDSAASDSEGKVQVAIPAVDGVAVLVDQPDFGPALLEGRSGHERREVRLDPGQPLTGTIELPASAVVPEGSSACAHGRFDLQMGGESRQWRRCAPVAANGEFALKGLPEGPVAVEVLVPGHLRLLRTLESRQDNRLFVERGFAVTGRVVDPQGQPVAGARIDSPGSVPAVTAARGRFTIAVGRFPAELSLTAPGYRDRGHTATGTGKLDLRLEPTEQIVGTLLGEPSDEVSEVEIRYRDVTPGSRRGGSAILKADDGKFRFDLPGPGSYLLRFLARGYRELVQRPVDVGSGQSVSLGVVQLSRGSGLRGVLIDAVEGTPVAGVIVEALPVGGLGLGLLADGRGAEGAISDRTGTFVLGGLDIGRYHVRWRRSGYATVHRLLDLEHEGLVDLGTMSLDGGIPLHGQLRDQDGETRPGLAVRLFDPANEVLVPFAEAVSNDNGEYRLEPIGPGRYRMQVSSERLLLAQEIELVPGSAEQRLDLSIGGAAVHGRLTYRGLPVSGGRVTAVSAFERRARVAPISLRSGGEALSFGRPPGAAIAEVDDNGAFTLVDVPEGMSWLAYADSGGDRRFLRSLVIPESAEFYVQVELEGQSLEGRVVDAVTGLGLPAEVALVNVTGVPFDRLQADRDGEFRFDDLEVGRFDLEVRAEEHVPVIRHDVDVSGDSQRQVIPLEPSPGIGRLEVALRRADGTAVFGVPATAVDAGGRRTVLPQVEGDRSFANLPAGVYVVSWSEPLHGVGASSPVQVGPGRRPIVERVLDAGASVLITCPAHRCGDAPVELLTVHSLDGVELTSMLSGIVPALRFSSAGDLSVGRLSPGRYVVRLWMDGEEWEREVIVGTGEARVRFH
jgi:hypothetical protein